MRDKDSTEYPDASDVFRSAREAIADVWGSFVRWVQGLPRLYQLAIGAVLSVGVQVLWRAMPDVIYGVNVIVSRVTAPQLLAVLIGVITIQTFVQIRGFKRTSTNLTTMNDATEARADGGQPRDRERMEEPKTSGGAAIGGAIAGAALGSSFGPGATVFGAVVGAIIGDEMEKGVY